MSKILNGKIVATSIKSQLAKQIKSTSRPLVLGIIQVGNNAASTVYIRFKIKAAKELGVHVEHLQLDAGISEAKLLEILHNWNINHEITGYIVQLPLPDHLNPDVIINAINPAKDVDGLTPTNKGLLMINHPTVLPATTRGILSLLDYYHIDVQGRKVVVLGRSNLVGMPTAIALLHKHATVTVLHSKSHDREQALKSADIVISAVGKPGLISADSLSSKSVVIDVGITEVAGKLHGDVDFDTVKDKIAAITPVPGGIGPLTVISLFQNLYDIADYN